MIFFEYPPEIGIKRSDISRLDELGDKKISYCSYWERICIKNAFLRAGFYKVDELNKFWTIMWSKHQNLTTLKELNCLQKVNHFPNSWCIGFIILIYNLSLLYMQVARIVCPALWARWSESMGQPSISIRTALCYLEIEITSSDKSNWTLSHLISLPLPVTGSSSQWLRAVAEVSRCWPPNKRRKYIRRRKLSSSGT